MIETVIGVWGLAIMVYFLNPLNNPNNPESLNCYYHPLNCAFRSLASKNSDERVSDAEWHVCATQTQDLVRIYRISTPLRANSAILSAGPGGMVGIDCGTRTAIATALVFFLRALLH